MDLQELFGGTTTVKVKFKGHTTHHVFADPTNEQDLEYRRRSAKVNMKRGRVETSEEALNAPLWLYSKLIQNVQVENGDGIAHDVPKEQWNKIPARVKMEAIAGFLSDVEREEAEALKD